MAPFVNILNTHETLRSAARFAVVGILGTLIDLTLFAVLHVQFGLPTLPANTLSYSAGILNNYFLHSKWTFRQRAQKAAAQQFARFAGVSLSALFLNNLIVSLLAPELGAMLAKLCAIGVGLSWNFIANHFWAFREGKG